MMNRAVAELLDNNGFAILPAILDPGTNAELLSAVCKIAGGDNGLYGVRNLLQVSPQIRQFAYGETVTELVRSFLGARAKVVRAILFDKTRAANWKVPWHQDLSIAVREKRECAGFGPWSQKAGVWHVQPPTALLERMLTLRFHLDDTDAGNGALKVVPRSHRLGRLSAKEIAVQRTANETTVCSVKKGDCLIMRPLLLHSSSAGSQPKHRRIIHLEFSADELPQPLHWHES